MPFSSNAGKDHIRRIVSRIPHEHMLDIGCGSGTYAKMFPGAKWSGVEIHEPYISEYGLDSLYGALWLADARKWTPGLARWDVAIAGDVLEHMTALEAQNLVAKLSACADVVIISIPIGHYPQDAWNGNEHERHVQDNVSDEDVRRMFGAPEWSAIEDGIGIYAYGKVNMRPKIAVYAISKNEEMFVQRFCNAAHGADLIMIADTGSTDHTVDVATMCGATVHQIHISPWRFDDARNAALALVPKDVDICVSLDLDEELQPGWREEIERVWRLGTTTRLRYGFDWGAGIVFQYEKIHARHGYRWHHPCHEYPTPDRIEEVWANTDMLLVIHKPDPTKSRGQYLDLLRISIEEDPQCPRNAFYYARELSFHSRWEEALAQVERYLALPRANWPNERCYAMRVASRCHAESLRPEQAMQWAIRACAEAPYTREPWCEVAMLAYRAQNWGLSYAAATTALAIKNREKVYTCDPAVWGFQPHDLAAVAAWNLGMYEQGAKHARDALDLAPDDARLRQNLDFFSQALQQGKPAL